MTLGDINLALSAPGEWKGTIRGGPSWGEKTLAFVKTFRAVIQIEDALVRFYMKMHMYETAAYEKAHTAEDMVDHLTRLNVAPIGWPMKWGPYGKCRHDTRLEAYTVEQKGIAEAVWIERTE